MLFLALLGNESIPVTILLLRLLDRQWLLLNFITLNCHVPSCIRVINLTVLTAQNGASTFMCINFCRIVVLNFRVERVRKPKLATNKVMLISHSCISCHSFMPTVMFYWATIIFYECTVVNLVGSFYICNFLFFLSKGNIDKIYILTSCQ